MKGGDIKTRLCGLILQVCCACLVCAANVVAGSQLTVQMPTSISRTFEKQHMSTCRSAYFRLGRILAEAVPSRAVLALTATATVATQQGIAQALRIPAANVHRDSSLRENLRLNAIHLKSKALNLLQTLLAYLSRRQAACWIAAVAGTLDIVSEQLVDVDLNMYIVVL